MTREKSLILWSINLSKVPNFLELFYVKIYNTLLSSFLFMPIFLCYNYSLNVYNIIGWMMIKSCFKIVVINYLIYRFFLKNAKKRIFSLRSFPACLYVLSRIIKKRLKKRRKKKKREWCVTSIRINTFNTFLANIKSWETCHVSSSCVFTRITMNSQYVNNYNRYYQTSEQRKLWTKFVNEWIRFTW